MTPDGGDDGEAISSPVELVLDDEEVAAATPSMAMDPVMARSG